MKKKVSILNIVLIILMMSGYSCKKTVETHFIKLETADGNKIADILSVEAEGLTQSIMVKSNGSWKIVPSGSDISWLSIYPDYGKENGSFSLVIEANATQAKREAKLSCIVNGQEFAVLQIVQESLTPGPPEISILPILDIVFKADGTAEDISPLIHNVSTIDGLAMTTVYSNTYQRYLARFNHTPGGPTMATGFYKMDYSSDQNFKNALSNGHTLETVFMLDLDSPLPNAELKMFSSHQSGGTGLMLGNSANNNAIIFLPHVGSGYAWTNSGITPERGKFYHVVGVWNKEEGKSYIYVNGVLKATANASGNFNFPSTGSNWFAIGADPTGVSAQTGWKGDVAIARVYDKPLKGDDIEMLWKQVEDFTPSPDEIQISGVSLSSKKVQHNTNYAIKGKGFVTGDKIKMIPVLGGGTEYRSDGTVVGNSLTFKIPTNLVTGQYRFFVVRGSKELDLGFATLTVVDKVPDAPQVIAHRGYWKTGAAQNSIASLAKAQELGVYGSEFDVWITTDGVVVINHDPTINGIRIENATYEQIKDITLSNGEKLPTLQDYLIQGKKDPSTKLILEIKNHSGSINGINNNDRASIASINMVKEANMTDQVEYIVWNLNVCKKILELQPNAIVAYLNGDIAPKDLHNHGIKGIDYNISVIRQHTDWITQAQSLGMKVNVWTVNSESDLQEMINHGVDYISTDYPVLAKQLIDSN